LFYAGLGVILLLLVGGFVYSKYFTAPSINSVAVLPFANDSVIPARSIFPDGLTESIHQQFVRKCLTCESCRATLLSASKETKIRQEDRSQLGSWRCAERTPWLKLGRSVSGETELINVADGSQLWGSEYNTNLADILSVQDEVSKKITQSLRVRLEVAKIRKNQRSRINERCRGLPALSQGVVISGTSGTKNGFATALTFFKQAEEKDPTYSLAFSGMADSYALLCDIGVAVPVEEMPKAKAAAQKAVDTDPNSAEGIHPRAHS
jgi:TolB-like protein